MQDIKYNILCVLLMSNTSESITWDNVIKKEARGAVDDSDFGEVVTL